MMQQWIEDLTKKDLLLMTWLPVLLITLGHYALPGSMHWAHDVLRRLYYLPLIYASIRGGIRVGCVVALVIIIAYIPHAFTHIAHRDPAKGIEKILEMVLYMGAAWLAGYLSRKEKLQRKRIQGMLEEQRRLMDQLVRAGRLSALGEVVAGIAHEVKNPLHSLLGTAEIIDPLIPHDLPERKMWENHLSELKRLGRISERFLSFAAPESGAMELVDMREVVARLEGLIATECRQRGVTLHITQPPAPIYVNGNLDQLAQVALNIALNGLKALEQSGDRLEVTLSCAPSRDRRPVACLTFANNGPRIREEELEKIFDPFHTTSKGNTGLGLSISSRIARHHDGYIEVANHKEGVVFTLKLPCTPGSDKP